MNKSEIVEQAKHGIMYVEFIKIDGSLRKMNFTLHPSLLPVDDRGDQYIVEKTRQENPDIVSVWDLDIKEWRSFRIPSIQTLRYKSDVKSSNQQV